MKKKYICLTCNKNFSDYISNGYRKYCSLSCRPSPRKGRDNRLIIICKCGKQFKKYKSQIKNYKGYFCSNKCKQKGIWEYTTTWNKGLKGFMAGEKNHLWRGGITSKNKKIRSSFEYKQWRIRVFIRDNFKCIWCGYRGKKLQADHIKPFSLYPELRFDINNGRTLCIDCHKKTDTFAGRIYYYVQN